MSFEGARVGWENKRAATLQGTEGRRQIVLGLL